MDVPELRSPFSAHSPKKGNGRGCDLDAGEVRRWIKTRDLESILRSEGSITTFDFLNANEMKAHAYHVKGEAPKNIELTSSTISEECALKINCSTGNGADCAFPSDFSQSTANHETSSTADHNPFHPYERPNEINLVDASECTSTTGSVKESEPLKEWRAMKQNCFFSSSHGGIPMPQQHARSFKRRKGNELKKKVEGARREQDNKFMRIAAPIGLLSNLNPGIINHVRNSKQVHSIIQAVLQSEKHVSQSHNIDGRKEQNSYQSSEGGQLNFNRKSPRESHNIDDSLALKLSTSVNSASEHARSDYKYFLANQDSIPSLSIKAARIAVQWLELLELDIKGRLAALRRSKKRVRNVIQTELPYLISREFSSNIENDLLSDHYSGVAPQKKKIPNMHVGHWATLFNQMDKDLSEEGKHLEIWLKQVQEMEAHCERGLRFVSADTSLPLGSSEDSSVKNKEAIDRECAIRAAAASIYSTCNLIRTENVQCC